MTILKERILSFIIGFTVSYCICSTFTYYGYDGALGIIIAIPLSIFLSNRVCKNS